MNDRVNQFVLLPVCITDVHSFVSVINVTSTYSAALGVHRLIARGKI